MALLVGMSVALALAALEIGIRTGWMTRTLSVGLRRPALHAGWTSQFGHTFRTEGRRGRTSPGHT